MSPLMIVITIAIIVLLFIILRYLLVDPYTLQGLQSGQTTSSISSTTLASNGFTFLFDTCTENIFRMTKKIKSLTKKGICLTFACKKRRFFSTKNTF